MKVTNPHRTSVLLVEDNRAIAALLQTSLSALDGVEAVVCGDYAETKSLLEKDPERFFISVLDLNLPDAPDGEVVDLVRSFDIPVIVLTGSVDEKKRKAMLKKSIADYVFKHHIMGINYVVRLVNRIFVSRNHPVLVVDDSPAYRAFLETLLHTHGYSTLNASNGEEGLQMVREHPEIRLVVTDYNMPKMDGLKMAAEIRQMRSTDELAIVAVSDTDNAAAIVPQFLKSGASDFLSKSFAEEEFFCRVDQNVDMIHYIQEARDAANRDFLTKLYNRRYFYEHAERLYRQAQKGDIKIAVAMIDADHFKSINDTFGHQIGDDCLVAIASVLKNGIGPDELVARFGGEEFVCLTVCDDSRSPEDCLEGIRAAIEAIEIVAEGKRVPLTASIGYSEDLSDNIDHMLSQADEALYEAKEGGRNQVRLFSKP